MSIRIGIKTFNTFKILNPYICYKELKVLGVTTFYENRL